MVNRRNHCRSHLRIKANTQFNQPLSPPPEFHKWLGAIGWVRGSINMGSESDCPLLNLNLGKHQYQVSADLSPAAKRQIEQLNIQTNRWLVIPSTRKDGALEQVTVEAAETRTTVADDAVDNIFEIKGILIHKTRNSYTLSLHKDRRPLTILAKEHDTLQVGAFIEMNATLINKNLVACNVNSFSNNTKYPICLLINQDTINWINNKTCWVQVGNKIPLMLKVSDRMAKRIKNFPPNYAMPIRGRIDTIGGILTMTNASIYPF